LNQSGYNCFTSTTTIKKPPDQNGATLVSTCGGTFIDTQTLSEAGTYTIVVDPKDVSYGSTTLTLYDVPADASGSAHECPQDANDSSSMSTITMTRHAHLPHPREPYANSQTALIFPIV
jgi:hypothetical protein